MKLPKNKSVSDWVLDMEFLIKVQDGIKRRCKRGDVPSLKSIEMIALKIVEILEEK